MMKKVRRLLAFLILVLLLTALAAPCAFADLTFAGDEESLKGEYDSTVFQAGTNPVSNADIRGIFFSAGNSVIADGSSEYAFVAGNTVTVSGTIGRDAFIAGNSVSFTGDCARDLAAAGNSVEIRGIVERDLAAGGKNVIISGRVDGNVYLAAESIVITDDAEINGMLRYNSSASISAPDALLSQATVYNDSQDSVSPSEAGTASEPEKASPLAGIKSRVFSCIGLLLTAFALLLLTLFWEKLDRDYTGKGFSAYAKAFGIGLAVLVVLPLAAIILMITGFGLRPALVLLFLYSAVLAAAPVVPAFFLGLVIWRRLLKRSNSYGAELAVGVVCWTILRAIPYLSFPLVLIAVCLGLGVITCMLGKKKHVTPPAVPSVPVASSVIPVTPDVPSAHEASTAPVIPE